MQETENREKQTWECARIPNCDGFCPSYEEWACWSNDGLTLHRQELVRACGSCHYNVKLNQMRFRSLPELWFYFRQYWTFCQGQLWVKQGGIRIWGRKMGSSSSGQPCSGGLTPRPRRPSSPAGTPRTHTRKGPLGPYQHIRIPEPETQTRTVSKITNPRPATIERTLDKYWQSAKEERP